MIDTWVPLVFCLTLTPTKVNTQLVEIVKKTLKHKTSAINTQIYQDLQKVSKKVWKIDELNQNNSIQPRNPYCEKRD